MLVAIFLAAAAALAVVGLRLVSLERAAAERAARTRLEGAAREGAGRLAAAATRLLSGAAGGHPTAVATPDGVFVEPPEPAPIVPLSHADSADAEARFYLAEAERAEARDGEIDRARGLYRAAAAPGRDPRGRAAALFRLSALERRAGNADAAAALLAEYLGAAPAEDRLSSESLIARAAALRPDERLEADLLRVIGSHDEALALGLLREAGLGDRAAIDARRAALARIDRLRPFVAVARAAVDAEARTRAALLGTALGVLVAGGGAALALSVRAARRAAAAARERSAFIAQVGHDLRTPLARIRLYAETLATGRVADPAEAREFASVALRESERLSGLVEKVLDLSRFESGARAFRPERLDLRALSREVADSHRALFDREGMRLIGPARGEPIPISADADALRGAIGNLLENALRHAAAGREAEVDAAIRSGRAEVSVLDRGPGIPPDLLPRLFARFVQGAERKAGGVGLGLALVREVAAAHRGTARAEPRAGGGAAFTISLPLAPEDST